MRRGVLGFFIKLFGEREEYMQAYPALQAGWKVKKDLAA
jgi:hypothetical protein